MLKFSDIKENLKKNRKSGLVVAIVNIPLSLSLAIASWATPLQWIITAIWAMIIAAIFASSKHNIFGPAWALSGILLGFSLIYWAGYFPYIAIISGVFLLIAYRTKVIRYITLIPAAGLQGFLFAVWLTILISQIPNALGITIPIHETIYLNIKEILLNLDLVQWTPTLVTIIGVIFLQGMKKIYPKIPWAIILSLLWIWIWFTIQQWWFPHMTLLIEKYPTLNFSLWEMSYIKSFSNIIGDSKLLIAILQTSAIIAIISILETIISGKIGERITKVEFNKDKEIFGNALANIGSGIMWGMPATGVLVRTALNIKSGATSKRSEWIASFGVLLICLLLFNGFFTLLPMSIIAAILISIAIGIMEFKILKQFYILQKTSFYIILITIIIAIFQDTVFAILIWTALTLLIYLKRISNKNLKVTVFRNKKFLTKTILDDYIPIQQKNDVIILKLTWEINYLNNESYLNFITKLKDPQMIIFSFSQTSDIDIDWIEALENIITTLKEQGQDVHLTGINDKWIKRICSHINIINQLQEENKIHSSTSELLMQYKI